MIMSGYEAGIAVFSDADGRSTETEQRSHCSPNDRSGVWEGPAANGRQLNGRYQQMIGPGRVEGTPTR